MSVHEKMTGWPYSVKNLTLTRAEIKKLVNANNWTALGRIFKFKPVYHFEGKNFIDWRCVPQSLLDVLQGQKKIQPPAIKEGSATNREKHLAALNFRQRLYKNQSGICHYCQQWVEFSQWSIDHRMPYGRGGTNAETNRIGACKECNNTKSCLTEEEFFELQPQMPGIRERASRALAKLKK